MLHFLLMLGGVLFWSIVSVLAIIIVVICVTPDEKEE